MINFEKGPEQMDRPEIIHRLFFPRRDAMEGLNLPNALSPIVTVAEGVSIGCRFYPIEKDGPNILYFHGNGETCLDYDDVAPLYMEQGMNLFVADFRGYGYSTGSPTCSAMIRDAHPTFHYFVAFLKDLGYTGDLFVMGRSLGSAPAIEVAFHYQEQLKGLIIESGFAGARNQFARLGVTGLFKDVKEPIGFGNDLKIKDITIPTLIIHGEEDQIIPAAEGRTLYALSGAAMKRSLLIPHAGHNDLLMEGMEAYMGAVEGFTRDMP
ncbi:MAG: alpha/beta hydrolase [Syntrophus sp. (in: bacteria)]|nr:alpha/beta hydrolase [Syntrophus sp. (in: bacteria)]